MDSKCLGVESYAEERRKESCGSLNLLVLLYLWEIKSRENSIGHDLSWSDLCRDGNAQTGCTAIDVLPDSLFCWEEGNISLCSKEGASFYSCVFVFVLQLTCSNSSPIFSSAFFFFFFLTNMVMLSVVSSSYLTMLLQCIWYIVLPILR